MQKMIHETNPYSEKDLLVWPWNLNENPGNQQHHPPTPQNFLVRYGKMTVALEGTLCKAKK